MRSVNTEYTSEESEERKVHVPLSELEQPVALAAENVSTDGFTARWEPVFRAMGYIIGLSKEYVAKEDVVVPLVHEDFDKITSGDLDWPYPFYDEMDDITNLPGWQCNYFNVRVVAGMFGLDNSYKNYGEEVYLASPVLDLSADGGKFTVRLDVYGNKDDIVSVTSGDKTLTHTLAEQGYQSFSLEFDNGMAASTIRIEFDGDGASKLLFFDDIYIEQTIHAGSTVKTNIGTYKTDTPVTAYDFTGLDASEGDTFVYTVTAWSYSLDEDGVWGPDVFSTPSEPVRVLVGTTGITDATAVKPQITVAGGVITVTVAEASVAEVYNVNGLQIGRYDLAQGTNAISLSANGVVIVRVGATVFRVLLN